MDNLSRSTQQIMYEQEIKDIFHKRELERLDQIPEHLRKHTLLNEREMPTITYSQKQAHTYQTSAPPLPDMPMNPSANSTETVKEYTEPLTPPPCSSNPLEHLAHSLKVENVAQSLKDVFHDKDEKQVVWGALILGGIAVAALS